ncbi:ankyrin-like protein [Pseudomonas aeruginosa]|nr:ankyrin-like protein [Pseudomonas aeruginosa]
MRGWILAGLLLAALAAQAGEVHGVEVEARLRDYFFDAARRGDQAMLKEFVEAGFDLDVQGCQGLYRADPGRLPRPWRSGGTIAGGRGRPLRPGCARQHRPDGRHLQGRGPHRPAPDRRAMQPDQRNGAGQTAAMYAALFEREELLQALSARGADLGARDALGNSVESLRRGELNGTARRGDRGQCSEEACWASLEVSYTTSEEVRHAARATSAFPGVFRIFMPN